MLDRVFKRLAADEAVKTLQKQLGNGKLRQLRADGLCGSSAAVVLSYLLKAGKKMPDTVLVVMNDLDEAGYFYHDLVQMLGEDDVLFFPSSYKRSIKYNQKDSANEILRTEVLARLGQEKRAIVVTYPDALAEKVVSKTELDEHSVNVKVGDIFDINELASKMIDLGFSRTDYVYEPGQFAVRGSIVDVYSFASDLPYRIDFFGDEVDSIRSFDVQSQLSQGKVDNMTIVPEVAGNSVSSVPVFDFINEDALVVSRNLVYVCDRVRQLNEEGFSTQARTLADGGQMDDFEGTSDDLNRMWNTLVVNEEDFVKGIVQFRHLEMRQGVINDASVIHFSMSPQPSFHKNFELVSKEFHRLIDEGYALSIFADSEKQIKRLQDIFSEMAETEMDEIKFTPVNRAIHEGFIDDEAKVCFFTDHQIFDRFHKYNLKSEKARRGKVALTLKELQQFEIGDYVVHIDHGVGRFGGLVRVPQGDTMQEMIKIIYKNDDAVYVSIHALHKVSKYKGKEGEAPVLNKIGSGAWERMKDKVKTKVKDIARDLILLYAKRKKEKGFAFSKDSYMQHELEASFVYEDTPDQLKAIQDVKADMEKERPMDRLVCGDVGFGKTEVAIRAAFKAACDGKQVAVLVPTTVLAYQHYKTFSSRLKDFPARVDYLSRARDAKATKAVLEDLKNGKIDIIIGTHKLISKQVQFKDLGLLIIDEEQKFGVAVKEKLRQVKVNVDTLTMTATPIPRTLQFSLLGARDLSVIQTPPPNRYPIQTEIHTFSADVFAEAVNFEMSRNGQVYVVNDKISNLPHLEAMIHERVPDARICVGHGQMNPQELERVVLDFMNHDYDVMLSTTIVENGIDVPNANTIIINSAQNYGLSDIHQMRGRVGRGNRKAFCYLIAPPLAALNDVTRRRLQAVENFSDLGSGIHIAMQDLDIRGAGNMLGAEQSGFIADLGYETYQKILNEAVAELKENEFAELFADEQKDENGVISGEKFVAETSVESDIAAFFPEEYVPVSGERMSLYRELDSLTTEKQLEDYRKRLVDRFGTIPPEGEELLRVMPVKWTAQKLGIEKVVLKKHMMLLYFTDDPLYYESRAFDKMLSYVQKRMKVCEFRQEKKRYLKRVNVSTMEAALKVLTAMDDMGE